MTSPEDNFSSPIARRLLLGMAAAPGIAAVAAPVSAASHVAVPDPLLDSDVAELIQTSGTATRGAVDDRLSTWGAALVGLHTKRLSAYGGSIAGAIAALPGATGAKRGEVVVDGEFLIDQVALVIPSGVRIVGIGTKASRLTLKANINWPALYVNGTGDALFADLTLDRESAGVPMGSQIGVQINGASSNVHLERLVIDGFYGGVRVRPGSGYTTGSIDMKNITLRDVTVRNSSNTYGIELAGVDGFVLDNCESSYNLNSDGLKLSGRTLNGLIQGGRYNHNKEEGIDAFTGGQNLKVVGVTCDENKQNGLIVKTDNVTASDPAMLAPRGIQFIGISCKNNGAHGMGIYKMNSGGTPPALGEQVALAQVTISSGEFVGNYYDGIFTDARNVTIQGVVSRLNGRHGIYVAANALHNTINGPVLAGNGRNKAVNEGSFTAFGGKAANIWIRGQHISLNGGILTGADADNVTDKTNLATVPRSTSYNVIVDGNADFVEVNPDWCDYQAEPGPNLRANKSTGRIVLHHKEDSSYPHLVAGGGATGGHGSTFLRTSAPGAVVEPRTFLKWSDAPNSTIGWRPVAVQRIAVLPTANINYEGWDLLKDNGVSPDTRHICVRTGPSTYQWKEILLS